MNDKSSEFITEFIDIYRQHPALWKIKSKAYANRRLREDGYSKLLKHYKTVNQNATIDTVKKKINNLRCAFRKELKKVKNKKSGTALDDNYTPSLWYYELLLFTADQEEMRETIGNDADELESSESERESDSELQIHETNSHVGNEGDLNLETPQSSIGEAPRRPSTKKSKLSTSSSKKQTIQEIALQKACEALDEEKDEFDTIGSNVAFKLRKMDNEPALFAENLINNILFNGLQRKLNAACTVQTVQNNNSCNSYVQPQANYSYMNLGPTPSSSSVESSFPLGEFLRFQNQEQ